MKLLNEAIDSRLIPEKKNVLNILIDNYSKELDSWQLDSIINDMLYSRDDVILKLREKFKIKEVYGKFIIIGLASMFILQSIFNILMNLNLWIESGFNLPFVSYGIGNLIMNVISLSIILSVYRRKDINLYEEGYEKKYEQNI